MRFSDKKYHGFTLIELMLAIAIMALVMSITFLTFSTVTKAWRTGQTLSEGLHHGEFVMEQLEMGLRSAYYSGAPVNSKYGFWMESIGESETISWVKLGTALVGDDCSFAGSPHRVIVSMEADEDGRTAVAVRSWRLADEPEDFDPEELEPVLLSSKVTSLTCQPMDPNPDIAGEIEWMDEWTETNRLPKAVKITLEIEPVDKDGEPVELQKVVEIPVASLSWAQIQQPVPGEIKRPAGGRRAMRRNLIPVAPESGK